MEREGWRGEESEGEGRMGRVGWRGEGRGGEGGEGGERRNDNDREKWGGVVI